MWFYEHLLSRPGRRSGYRSFNLTGGTGRSISVLCALHTWPWSKTSGITFFGMAIVGGLCLANSVEAQVRNDARQPPGIQRFSSLASMLERVLPAVVSLRVTGIRLLPTELSNPALPSGLPDGGQPKTELTYAGGSGVVIDAKQGLILTNQHVVAGARTIDVTTSDGRILAGELIGMDVGSDIALVRAKGYVGRAMLLGNSDRLRVGDVVVTIGSPFGLDGSTSAGIVSALNRFDLGLGIFEGFIQTDAAINSGNSGGALVSRTGELVGINTASGGGRAPPAGIGFAVPINYARAIADQLAAYGSLRRGAFGFGTITLTPSHVAALNLPFPRGALITQVFTGTPAASTGIKDGDVIVKIDGKPVRSSPEYVSRVAALAIGTPAKLTVYTKGKFEKLALTVAAINMDPPSVLMPPAIRGLLGASLSEILPGSAAFGVLRGARVISIEANSPAEKIGLRRDDIITAIDNSSARSVEDVFRRAKLVSRQYRVDFSRGGHPFWVRVEP